MQNSRILHNRYNNRLSSNGDLTDEIIKHINNQNGITNILSVEVEEKRWTKRTTALQLFQPDQLIDFPHLNEKEFKILFTGSYQLAQAVSYLAGILENNNQPKPFM